MKSVFGNPNDFFNLGFIFSVVVYYGCYFHLLPGGANDIYRELIRRDFVRPAVFRIYKDIHLFNLKARFRVNGGRYSSAARETVARRIYHYLTPRGIFGGMNIIILRRDYFIASVK